MYLVFGMYRTLFLLSKSIKTNTNNFTVTSYRSKRKKRKSKQTKQTNNKQTNTPTNNKQTKIKTKNTKNGKILFFIRPVAKFLRMDVKHKITNKFGENGEGRYAPTSCTTNFERSPYPRRRWVLFLQSAESDGKTMS